MLLLRILGLIELGLASAVGMIAFLLLVLFALDDSNSRGIIFVIIPLVITILLTLLLSAMGFTATQLEKVASKFGQINAERIAIGLQVIGGLIFSTVLILIMII